MNKFDRTLILSFSVYFTIGSFPRWGEGRLHSIDCTGDSISHVALVDYIVLRYEIELRFCVKKLVLVKKTDIWQFFLQRYTFLVLRLFFTSLLKQALKLISD